MTMVHIRLRAPTNGGTRAGVGMVVFQPSARHADDASVVLPDTFTVVLDEEGEATVDIQPTGPDWCWKTDEQVPYGSIRWFTVPDTAGTLEYAELTDVDPRTFKPGRNLAAWQAVTGDIKTMIDSMPRFLTGHGSPTIDGKPGDIYLDLDTMDLYANNQERN